MPARPVVPPGTPRVGAARLAALLHPSTASRASGVPGYAALADGVRTLVLDGRLPVGTLLPSERDLAAATGTSRTTTAAAYRTLREAGFACGRQGAGTWITLPGDAPDDGVPQARAWGVAGPEGSAAGDLAMAAPAAPSALYPAYTTALADLPRYLRTGGYLSEGLGSLRERIAARCTVRGQATVPEQVLVTAGAAQGLRLAIAAVVTPGAPVLVEHPTWPPLLDAVRAAGGRPVALPVEDGWDVDAAASLVRRTGATAAALMVDGQNPTGRLLTGAPRVALAQVLARAGVSVVVNETLADLDLRAHLGLPCTESAPAFAGLTPPGSGEVISVGSASKTFWGGLRVGWVRASTPTVRRLTLARVAEDLGGSVLEQLTLVHLLDRAPEVIEERRAHLAAQCRGLQELLAQHLPSWSAPAPQAGLVLWCRLPAPISTAVASAARREGLIVTAGSRFAVGGGIETRLRLPFARPAEDLAGDVARLARAVADLGDFAAAPLEESEPAAVV